MAVDIVTDMLVLSILNCGSSQDSDALAKEGCMDRLILNHHLDHGDLHRRVFLVRGSTTQLQSGGLDTLFLWSNVECGIGKLSDSNSQRSQTH